MPRTGGGEMVIMKAPWIAPSRRLQIGDDLGRREALGGALVEGLQRPEDGAGVRRIGEGGAIEAGEGHRMGDALGAEDDLGGLRG